MQMDVGLLCYPATYVLSAVARPWALAFKLDGARGRLSGHSPFQCSFLHSHDFCSSFQVFPASFFIVYFGGTVPLLDFGLGPLWTSLEIPVVVRRHVRVWFHARLGWSWISFSLHDTCVPPFLFAASTHCRLGIAVSSQVSIDCPFFTGNFMLTSV